MKVRALLIAGAVLGVTTESGRADLFHSKDILIGERASGLGGAFTAISDDPTGIYYNPAGLIYAHENYLSASAITFVSSESVAKNVVNDLSYTLRSSGMSPSFFGFSQSFGGGKIGFAVVIPDSESINQDDQISGLSNTPENPDELLSFSRKFFQEDTTYLFGPAYSRGFGKRSSWGVSLFGLARRYRAIDNQLLRYTPESTGRYFLSEIAIDGSVYGLLPKVGVQHALGERWVIGATISRRVQLRSRGTIRGISTKTDPDTGLPVSDPSGAFTGEIETFEQKIRPRIPSPWNGTLGGAWFIDRSLLVTAELDYHSGDPSFRDYKLNPTLNWAVGSEWFLSPKFALRGGVYSNLANTPQVSPDGVGQLDHVDLFGGALSVSFLRPGTSFTLGAFWASGTGRGQVLAGSTDTQEVTRTVRGLSLSGSYQL